MPKYLIAGNYVGEGIKGLMKDGGTGRRAAVEQMTAAAGGQLEAFYYAFGDTDVFAIAEIPDASSAAALSMAVNASGLVRIHLTPLLTPEDMDAAAKKPVAYRAPGR